MDSLTAANEMNAALADNGAAQSAAATAAGNALVATPTAPVVTLEQVYWATRFMLQMIAPEEKNQVMNQLALDFGG